MQTDAKASLASPRTLARVLIAALGVGLFFAAASIIEPDDTVAIPSLPTTPEASAGTTSEKLASLGRFEAVDHVVHAVATPEGPRYTITDAAGAVLESNLEFEQVRSALEAHGYEPGAETDNGAPLMLLDPAELDGLFD